MDQEGGQKAAGIDPACYSLRALPAVSFPVRTGGQSVNIGCMTNHDNYQNKTVLMSCLISLSWIPCCGQLIDTVDFPLQHSFYS